MMVTPCIRMKRHSSQSDASQSNLVPTHAHDPQKTADPQKRAGLDATPGLSGAVAVYLKTRRGGVGMAQNTSDTVHSRNIYIPTARTVIWVEGVWGGFYNYSNSEKYYGPLQTWRCRADLCGDFLRVFKYMTPTTDISEAGRAFACFASRPSRPTPSRVFMFKNPIRVTNRLRYETSRVFFSMYSRNDDEDDEDVLFDEYLFDNGADAFRYT